jgi:O-antigen ligase
MKFSIFNSAVVVFALILPIYPPLLTICALWLCLGYIQKNNKLEYLRYLLKQNAVVSSIALWILYLFSISYSTDQVEAWNIFPTKSALLVFPILFSPLIAEQGKIFHKIKVWFIYGCAVSVLLNCGIATFHYFTEIIRIKQKLYVEFYGINYFLSSRISAFMHPSYWAMYLNWGTALLLFDGSLKIGNLLKSTVLFILLLGVLLSASKSGLVCTLLIAFILAFRTICKPNQHSPLLKYIIIMLISIPFLLFKIAPEYSSRYINALNLFSAKSIKPNTIESNELRIVSWNASIELISHNPVLGVGLGDAKHELQEIYKERNQFIAYEKALNSHNQFLQTAFTIGLFGFILLFSVFAFGMQLFKQSNSLIGMLFLFLIAINFLFESMLEAQAGIIFILFWLVFLITEQKSSLQ